MSTSCDPVCGYDREFVAGMYVRVVRDRKAARKHLRFWWPNLPKAFFEWLRYAEPGSTRWLTECVAEPELWVFPRGGDTE